MCPQTILLTLLRPRHLLILTPRLCSREAFRSSPYIPPWIRWIPHPLFLTRKLWGRSIMKSLGEYKRCFRGIKTFRILSPYWEWRSCPKKIKLVSRERAKFRDFYPSRFLSPKHLPEQRENTCRLRKPSADSRKFWTANTTQNRRARFT